MSTASRDLLFEVLKETAYHDRGIVPIKRGCSHHDANRDLEGIPAEERRAMKRKFRKEWRKVARQFLGEARKFQEAPESDWMRSDAISGYVARGLGFGAGSPDRKQKRWRKLAVACSVLGAVREARYLLKKESDFVQSNRDER